MQTLDLVRNKLGKPYADLQFLLDCLKEVLAESGETELAGSIPWLSDSGPNEVKNIPVSIFSSTPCAFSC